jgi:hypothetical protein
MTAKPGERAYESGTFHCDKCSHTVRVEKGEIIPPCPCGGGYGERTGEPPMEQREFRAASPDLGEGGTPEQRRNLEDLKRRSDAL